MSVHEQNSPSQYPSLMMTMKTQPEVRPITESSPINRNRRSKDNYRPSSFYPKNVYYNSHHRQQTDKNKQYFVRSTAVQSVRRQQNHFYNSYDHIHHCYQDQTIRPLMEIEDNLVPLHNDPETIYQHVQQRDPKQRGQYRNRKAELDWDHAFDLDLIDFYKTNFDLDNFSMTSTISSSDHSFSSI